MEREGNIDLSSAFMLLRDHGAKDYLPDKHFLSTRLCAHSANKLARNASQSTGSLVAHLKKDLQTYWATGTSAPCTGVFKPIWFGGEVLPSTGPTPTGTFNPQTLWWRHEELHRSVMLDYGTRIAAYMRERDRLEMSFLETAHYTDADSRFDLTQSSFKKALDATEKWTDCVRAIPRQQKSGVVFRRYWEKQNKKAGIGVR
jgi:dipeptidase